MTGLSSYFKQRRALLLGLLYIGVLLIASWAIQNEIRNIARKNISDTISTVLGITHQGMLSWYKEEKAEILIWANNPTLRQYATELLTVSKTAAGLKKSQAQTAVRTWLEPVLSAKGYKGFFIIGPDGINLASTRDANLGLPNLLKEQQGFLDRVWNGYPSVSIPQPSDVPLLTPDGIYVHGLPTMFTAAPITNERGDKIAVLSFRLDPFSDFTAILHRGRIGPSGETYAFDRSGHMISESRFRNQLIDIGLLKQNQYSEITSELRDPGANLLLGERPKFERDQQPLTFMAKNATAGKNGVNVDGYRDYRGVPVVGAWLWDSEINIGIASEIDYAEAFAGVRANQIVIILATVLLVLLGVGLGAVFLRSQESEKAQKIIKESEKRLIHILTGIPHGIALFDSEQRLQDWNETFRNTFHYPEELMQAGTSISKMILVNAERGYYGEGDRQFLVKERQNFLDTITSNQWEFTQPNGKTFEVVSLRTEEGDFLVTSTDITERKQAEEKLKHLATHDALTGLPSLRLAKDHLAKAIAMARRNSTTAVVLFIDLDGFKMINDTNGHEAGNKLLSQVADRLTSCVREVDSVARIGGDEFLVVLTNVNARAGAEKVAQSLLTKIEQPFYLENCVANVGASIGIALYPEHGEKPDEIIKKADEAMYVVKSKGKNNFEFATN